MTRVQIPKHSYVKYKFNESIERFVEEAYGKVNQFIEAKNLEHGKGAFVIEEMNYTNDLMDKQKNDNEIELMMPII
jgi:predicted transcriptional regulator YdeE